MPLGAVHTHILTLYQEFGLPAHGWMGLTVVQYETNEMNAWALGADCIA